MTLNIYFDGSCKPAYGSGNTKGGIVFEEDEEVILTMSVDFGEGTNNYAEFKALWFALIRARQKGYKSAICYGDSTLVIDAMNGVCPVRDPILLKIFLDIEHTVSLMDWVSFIYVKRNTGLHELADHLSKT